MTEIRQVRLSGFGGQGVVLAGLLLGQAGVIEGKYITGSNSYGAQARGSGCKSEIIFSDSPISFPHLTTADILVALSQGAYQTYGKFVYYNFGVVGAEFGLQAAWYTPVVEMWLGKLTPAEALAKIDENLAAVRAQRAEAGGQ